MGSLNIINKDSIKYLGLPFGPSNKATRELVLSSVLGKLRKTYGLLVRVKGRFDKQTLARILANSPNKLYVISLLGINFVYFYSCLLVLLLMMNTVYVFEISS